MLTRILLTSFVLEAKVLYFLDALPEESSRAPKKESDRETHSGPFAGHFSSNHLYKVHVGMWWWDGM